LKIGPTAVKSGADLVRLATGDKYGTGISEAMQTGMESIDQTIGTKRFNDQQKAFSNLMQDDTKSVGDMFSFLIDNPSIAVDNGITTIGSMFLPAGAAKTAATGAKLIGAGTKTATKAAIATSIGASAAQNAADTFDALKDKPIENRYQGAAISAAVSILSGIATGGGAEAAIAKKLAGDVQSGKVGLEAVKSFLKSAFKEGAQESGEEVGNIIGESVGNEAVPNMTNSAKRTAFAGTLGAAMGGGTDVFLGSPDQGGAVVDTNKQSITTDGRIEPDANGQTPTPAELSPIDVHPTTAAADQVVSDLVDQYGVPDHVVASDLTPQQNTGKPSYSDDDVVSFADSRYEQLLAKRDGTLETVMGDDGKPSQQEIAGSGLSPAEVQELNALEQAQANPQALRKLYGFDQSQQAAPAVNPTEQPTQGQSFPNVTEPALAEIQNEESNRQAEEPGLTPSQDSSVTTGQPSGATVEPQQTDNAASTQNDVSNSVGNTEQQDSALQASRPVDQTGNFATAAEAKQFISNQRRQSGGKLPPALPRPFADGTFGIAVKNGEGWDDALAHQEATKPKTEKQAKEQRQNGQAETQVQAAQAEQAQTQESEKPATVKPRTEKEARAQKDYSDKWFGTSDKAQAFIDKQGIGDSHAVVNEGKRFLIKPKVAETAPTAQTVEETATSNQPTSVEDLQKQLRDVERELDSQGAVQNANTRKRRDDIATAIAEAKHPEILKAVNNQAKWADSVANAIEFNQDGDKSGAINRALKAQGVVEPSLSDMTSRVMKAIGETENNPTTEQPKQTNWKDTLTTARNYANGLIEAGKVSNRDQQRLKDHWGNKGSIVDIVNKVESPEYQLDMQAEKPDVANEQKPTASTNTVFTDDAAEKARALLRSKLGQLNSGIDPEVMQAGITLAGYHIEKGARTFAAYSKAMLEDMGDIVKPYLKSWYLGVKFDPRAAGFTGMDDAGVVEKADIDAPVAKAENEQKPQESGNDTRANQATSEGDSGNRADDQSRSGQENQESVANPASEDVGKATTGRDDQRPSTDSASGDVGSGGSVRKSRTPANGRKGTSGTRLADDGAREERGNADVVESQRANYHIDDPDTLIGGTPKIRFARNKKAIEAYQSITSEGRAPTQDELDSMAAYIGWGSFGQELFQGTYEQPRPKDGWKDESDWLREHLGKADWESAQKSIINAHYTDPITVGSMWDMVRQLGFTQGRVLEPSMGIGNFYGLMPKDLAEQSQLTGIEMDSLTGGMAKVLYPDANIQIKPYQDSKTADGFYDLVIGNWPFAKDGPADRRYMRLSPSLHDYFFLKALDQVRAGGLVVGITSAGTMDKKGTLTRAALAEKADLVAAFRLPSGAFEKYAGTSVVTDIIILKKRDTPNADVKASGWLNTAEVNTPSGNKVTVNEYFANNPDRVLGTLNFSHGSTYGRPAMVVNRPDDLEARLKGLAKTLPAGVFEQVTTKAKTTQYITNNTTDRQQSITEQSGKLYQVQGEYLAPLDDVFTYKVKDAKTTANRLQQIKDLIGMRRAYGELIDAERNGDENTEAKRKALRQAYEAFTRANGSLIGSYGLSALKKVNDPFYPSLAALEMPDGSPSAILSKPTIRAKRRLDKPTVRDALVLARNESIYLSMDRVAELSGVPVDEAAKELIDAGAIFKTPDGNYEVSDVYLSGNVRRKLREAQDAADQGVDMKRNIEALTDVLPQDVPYFNIEPKLGATWIRPEQYGEFIAHLLGVKPSDDIQVRWAVNRWKVSFHDKSLNNKPEATTTWGHTGVKFDKLLNAAMGNVAVKVQYKDEDGNLQTDEVATAEANNKAQQIREEFANWLWSDPVRKIEMERTYNEVMNAIALPKYDGSFLSFEGMALQRGDSPFNLRKHQIDAIWRGLANGRSLNAHEVGTGKTYTMGGLAVESRRYGIAKKPIIFAHNANSASVAREIGEMYPGAKLLYIDNLAPDKIGVTLRQIQTDDWDAVVVPHSLIDRFTLKKETLMDISREQIEALEQEAIEAAQEDGSSIEVKDMDDPDAMKKVRSATAKQLVHARNAIIKKIDDMAMRSSREDAISFEDMGIDMVIVDEAHEFKKPPLATRMRMKGLNTQSSAQSISLMFLTDYVKKLNNGSGVHLFTGTPITNTMTEIYNMMRYVMDDQMSRDGIRDWDAWFNTFADSTSDVELTAAGDYEPVTRLASFVNVAELRRMIGQYMDIVFADDMPEFKPRETKNGKTLSSASITDKERNELLNGRTENPIGRPYKKVVSDIAEMTDQQKGILALLQQRANTFKRATKKERREMMLSGSPNSPVIVETDSANAGLDARLFDIESGDAPTSKVNRAVKRIMEHYNEHDLATQVVFVERGFTSESVSRKKDKETGKVTSTKKERFNLVKDLVAKLVDQGVPVNQIAIVDGSTSKEKRKAIADAMNRAEIRVVIGNTKTLGVGVNMQTNLRAMHHLDAPWMPGDLEQRNGRGHRQGNKWNTVMEYRYLTERIDGRRWQVLAVKDRFIKAFLKAKDDVRVIDGDAVSMDEEGDIGSTLAEAAGDPRLLMMNKLRGDVQKLETKERMHSQGVFDAAQKIKSLNRDVENYSTRLDALRADDESFRKVVKDGLSVEVANKLYDDAEKANEAIAKQIERMEVGSKATKLGTAWGFDIYGYWPGRAFNAQYYIESGKNRYDMGKPTVESARATLYAIKGQAEKLEGKIADAKDSLPRMEEATKAPFARAADLEKKRGMLAAIETDIQINPVPAPAWLRNGAPAGSEAFVGGKPVVVEGHRWTNDGYLVTVTEGEKTNDVDYLDVKDENGLPIYDVQPFAIPEIAKPAEQEATTFNNLMRSPASGVSTAPEQVRVNARTKLKSLEKRRDEGKLTEAEYRLGVQQVIAKLEQREEAKIERRMESGRRRGADWIMAQLRKGVANDTVPRVEAEFAQWLLDQNPQLADDLGISITGKDGNGSAGQYNDITKVIKLFSAGLGDGTVVHEILHHIERMMPRDVQDGILKAWRKAWNDAYKSAKPEVKKGMDIMLAAALGDKAAYDSMVELFQNGTLDYDTHYQLFSPSEFWAVNATKILSGRFNANGSWTKKAAQWLREFVQRVKGLLGLQSDAPILKALNAVMKGDGTFQSSRMLGNRINEGEGVLAADLDRGVEYNNIIRKVQNNLVQFYDNRGDKNLDSWNSWDRSLATQFHKALKDKHYGKVFALINAMQNEVSLTSIRPAELAPGVLPRVDDIRSAWDVLRKGKKMDSNLDAASKAIFAGTLAGASVMEGKVWTDEELRNTFKLNDAGVALYRQTRAAIDASLDETAAAEAYAMAQGFIPKAMRRMVIDNPRNAENILTNELDKQISMLEMAVDAAKAAGNDTQVASFEDSLAAYHETVDRIAKIFNTSRNLKTAGYAPLMRFGRYEVTAQLIDPETGKVVRDENGESITLFYSQYETQGEAKAAYKQKQAEFADRDDVRLSQGRKSEMSHELYSGISPETLALFAEAVGLDKTTKQFYQNALTERSALKRRLERKGTAGYSSDMPRVLSNFITSNGRFAAQRYYLRDINNSIKYIPKEKGDVKDEAIKIKNFILNPNDPAAPVSAALFAWFLGGSVASAVVNLSQPVMMTGPYLSQYGVSEATSAMAKALPIALGKKQITDHVLKEALKRAGQEGIVDAQEIFHLYSIGAQNVASGLVNALSKLPGVGNKIKAGGEDARARANAFLTLWGSMFAMAESFNRKLTFVAAWDVAKATGKKDPYAFAVRAVNETQGIYNKVNRPNWARGPVGRTVLTFKQYSIMYVELLSRLAKHGGPEGKRAALMMLAVLMLASGEEGLPFSQDLDDLIDTIGQILGYDTNARRWKRRNAYEIFGKEMGDLSLYGISSMLPMDFSNRLGLGNLIPGTGLIKASDENNQSRNIEEIFGAGAGMLGQMGDAVNAAIDRNWGKAAQNIMPTAIKNLSGGLEMAKKGYATDSRGRKVVETTGVESVGKMLGFNPTVVAQETRRTAPQQQDIALQKRTEASITDLWAQGMADNDQEAMDKAAKRLDDWNRDNPDTPIRISPDQIRDKKRKLLQDKESRLIKSAPRELRARIGLELTK
jgi:N12 class adenine-specific DNA methylase